MRQACTAYETKWRTEKPESCEEMMMYAFIDAVTALNMHNGRDIYHWEWGYIHENQYPYQPFAKVPILNWFYLKSIPFGGNKNTVNLSFYFNILSKIVPGAQYPWFPGTHSANLRVVADMANDDVWMSIDTGQSETIFSPHFFNQNEMHMQGHPKLVHVGKEHISKYSVSKIELVPKKSAGGSSSDL